MEEEKITNGNHTVAQKDVETDSKIIRACSNLNQKDDNFMLTDLQQTDGKKKRKKKANIISHEDTEGKDGEGTSDPVTNVIKYGTLDNQRPTRNGSKNNLICNILNDEYKPERIGRKGKIRSAQYNKDTNCHQCKRNDKGRVVGCQKCGNKRYCVPCMTTWYPNMTEEMFAECCPVCLDNCNCKSCLRDVRPNVKQKIDFEPSVDQKVQCSIYMLHVLLPFLERLNKEHIQEKLIESKIQGCTLSEVRLEEAQCALEERMYCDCCKTSIFHLHRSCRLCHYDLCLQCCRELRDGNPQGYKDEVPIEFNDPGSKYLHGGEDNKKQDVTEVLAPEQKKSHDWKSGEDGRIPCPPESMGGCGLGILELMHIDLVDPVSTLLGKAQDLLKTHKLDEDMREMHEEWCTCSEFLNKSDADDNQLRKAASRENSNDNYLY